MARERECVGGLLRLGVPKLRGSPTSVVDHFRPIQRGFAMSGYPRNRTSGPLLFMSTRPRVQPYPLCIAGEPNALLVALPTSGDLFVCAKQLLGEANEERVTQHGPLPWRAFRVGGKKLVDPP